MDGAAGTEAAACGVSLSQDDPAGRRKLSRFFFATVLHYSQHEYHWFLSTGAGLVGGAAGSCGFRSRRCCTRRFGCDRVGFAPRHNPSRVRCWRLIFPPLLRGTIGRVVRLCMLLYRLNQLASRDDVAVPNVSIRPGRGSALAMGIRLGRNRRCAMLARSCCLASLLLVAAPKIELPFSSCLPSVNPRAPT